MKRMGNIVLLLVLPLILTVSCEGKKNAVLDYFKNAEMQAEDENQIENIKDALHDALAL